MAISRSSVPSRSEPGGEREGLKPDLRVASLWVIWRENPFTQFGFPILTFLTFWFWFSPFGFPKDLQLKG